MLDNIPLKTSVRNMISSSGREVANQFVISTTEGQYFQSYSSVIVFVPFGSGRIVLDKNKWAYSITTGKYRNLFLHETKKDTECKIASGEYVLADLNS